MNQQRCKIRCGLCSRPHRSGFVNFAQTDIMPELAKEDYYYSKEGYLVFTEQYHLKRGYCCQSGCKHCPFGFDKKTGTFRK